MYFETYMHLIISDYFFTTEIFKINKNTVKKYNPLIRKFRYCNTMKYFLHHSSYCPTELNSFRTNLKQLDHLYVLSILSYLLIVFQDMIFVVQGDFSYLTKLKLIKISIFRK